MKSWFTKFRISAARDDGNEPSASLQRSLSKSPELRGFEQQASALDRALRQTAPKAPAPADLHASIMRAVRAAEPVVATPPRAVFLRWLPAPVAAVVAAMLIWHALRGPVQPAVQDTQALAAATTALEISGQIPEAMPSAVVSPLSDELQKVHQDLTNTAAFLLASLP